MHISNEISLEKRASRRARGPKWALRLSESVEGVGWWRLRRKLEVIGMYGNDEYYDDYKDDYYDGYNHGHYSGYCEKHRDDYDDGYYGYFDGYYNVCPRLC